MIYSHYSEYMAKSMSAGRPGPDPGEYEFRNVSTILRQLTSEFREQLLRLTAPGLWICGQPGTTPFAHTPTAATSTAAC
jgi:hypothetical protein